MGYLGVSMQHDAGGVWDADLMSALLHLAEAGPESKLLGSVRGSRV